MANLQETPTWETGIYQFEITDPVLGGPDGIDNVPTKQLANRTAYLKQQVESTNTNVSSMGTRLTNVESTNTSQNNRLNNVENSISGIKAGAEDFTTQPTGDNTRRPATTEFVIGNRGGTSGTQIVNTNITITAAMAGKTIHHSEPGNSIYTVPENSIFKNGDVLIFLKTNTGVLQINFTNFYAMNGPFKSVLYLHGGELVQFVRIGEYWAILNGLNVIADVGSISFAHSLLNGHLELNGATLSRAAYPRLWEYAQTTNIVSESAWTFQNKGRFSTGDGSTTFRLPDFRDTFTRSKSTTRDVGTYEADAFASHQHLGVPGNQSGPFNQIGTSPGSNYKLDGSGYTNAAGEGNETRPKNIALLQMIKY